MRFVHAVTVLVLGVITSGHASANDAPIHPVVVRMTSGDLSADASNKVVKSATDAVSVAALESLAQVSYATDPKIFPAAQPFRGQVDVLFHTLKKIDAGMSDRFSKMKPTPGGKRDLNFQLFWTSKDIGDAPVPGEMVELLVYLLTQNQVVPAERQKELALARLGLRTRVLDGEASTIKSLKAEVFERFADITTMDTSLPAFPLHFDVKLAIDSQKGVIFTSKFTFSISGFTQERQDVGSAILDRMVYAPFRQGRGVIEFSMNRFYPFGTKNASDPVVTARFGRIQSDDIAPRSCVSDECLKWIDALPTMYMSVNPQTNSWFTRTKAWIASFDRFELMIRSFGINLGTMGMSPQDSELLFVVDTYTGRKKVIDMSKTKARNWFEYFAQRQGAIEGEILPNFDGQTRETLNEMMSKNLDSLLNQPSKK